MSVRCKANDPKPKRSKETDCVSWLWTVRELNETIDQCMGDWTSFGRRILSYKNRQSQPTNTTRAAKRETTENSFRRLSFHSIYCFFSALLCRLIPFSADTSMPIWQLLWQKVCCYCLDFNLLSAVYALFPFVATLNGIIIGTVTAICVCVRVCLIEKDTID